MTVKFKLDSRAVPEGTILLFGIRYVGPDSEGFGRSDQEEAKVYTYAMLKAGGFWYVTGGGRTPQVAGWGAIERWLERDGRVVEWVKHVTETAQLWPETHVPPIQVRDESIHDDGGPCRFIAGACSLCGATPTHAQPSQDPARAGACGDHPAPCNCDDPQTHDEPLNPGGMNPDGSIDGSR